MDDDLLSKGPCAVCRFDGAHYTDDDVAGTFRSIHEWVAHTIVGVPTDLLTRAPRASASSPMDGIRQIHVTLDSAADLLRASAEIDSTSGSSTRASIDVADEMSLLDLAASRLTKLWAAASRETTLFDPGVETPDAATVARDAAHRVTHTVSDIGRALAELGVGTPEQAGTVTRIQTSHGGVPKSAVASAAVGYRGLDGDRQSNRLHHGRVSQAVCLWSDEVIDVLRAEGHPIAPGLAGENLTLSGIAWASVRPGARFQFGETGPLLEATGWATPCSNLKPYFAEQNVRRVDVDRHPGFSRLYAKVLRDGVVTTNDSVQVF